jgi:actin-related protein
MSKDKETIIIDNGSFSCKAGFSEDDMPRVDIPTVIGYPINQGEELDANVNTDEQTDIFVGEDAISKGGTLKLKYPIEKGVFTNFPVMKDIWKHIFYNELLADPKSHAVIITEPPLSPYSHKKEIAHLVFDVLNADSLYIATSSTLALYANGKTTGLVVDIGYETTSCVPIYEGFVLNHAINKIEMGGEDLTKYFSYLLNIKKENLHLGKDQLKYDSAERTILNNMKEQYCEVAEDFDSQVKKCMDSKFMIPHELPDKRIICIGAEKYQCPELLFAPSNYQKEYGGIHELTFRSIKKCDDDIHKDLFSNVVLCGGSSLFPNIKTRFQKELGSLAPTGKKVNVIAPPERKYSTWLGGAILASLDQFKDHMFLKRSQYLEGGENEIYKRFI